MPKPTGSKQKRCAQQRAIFNRDPVAGRKWVEEFGDQCKGVSMVATRKIAKNSRKKTSKKRGKK